MKHKITILAVLLVLLLTSAMSVSAHGYIVRSVPEDRVTLERPPTRLQYWFSEGLEPDFSQINLRDQSGDILATGGIDALNDTLLALQVPSDLPDGAYIVELRPAFASDGHVVAESRVFFVGEAIGGVEGEAASDRAEWLEVVWRALLSIAATMLFGLSMLYNVVLVPAWGSDKYPAGRLPGRLMARLNMLMWAGIGLALVGSVIALLQQTMVFFNASPQQVISGGLWQVVRIGSRFGDVWNARLVLLVLVAAMQAGALYYRSRSPRAMRPLLAAQAPILALLVGAASINSHAAGSLIWPWVAVFVHWLHTLAVAFWVGGAAALALVLPVALRPYTGQARADALAAVMRRFSRWMVGAVALVVTSGIYNALNWFFTPADLASNYGSAMGIKLLMVLVLLVIGALHHLALHPERLEMLRTGPMRGLIETAGRFGVTMRLEAVAAVVTLVLAALLTATPIPEPEFLDAEVVTPVDQQQVNDRLVAMSVIPGGPGVNTYDTVIADADDDFVVEVQMIDPQRGIRGDWLPAEPVGDGLYVAAGDEIDQAGSWQTLVDAVAPDGTRYRAAYDWTISADAAVIQSRPPSALNLLALAAILAVIGWLVYPSFRRGMDYLDLSPTNVLAGGGVIALTTAALIIGAIVVDQQQAAYQQALQPPPAVINPVLADQASLDMGEVLYNDHCIRWQNVTDFQPLMASLPTFNDDDLFAVTAQGWRDVPACEGELSDEQRWHIVNYVRFLGKLLSGASSAR